MEYIKFGYAKNVSVTVLVDNMASLIVKSNDFVHYFVEQPLLAEHGFAALVSLNDLGVNVLWDGGFSQLALLENMKRMKIAPKIINKIALSHGHNDHTGAITEILRAISILPEPQTWEANFTMKEFLTLADEAHIPIIAHPAVFRERWEIQEDGVKAGPYSPPSRAEWEAAGGRMVLSTDPLQLYEGCWTTGAIPQDHKKNSRKSSGAFYREGAELIPDDIDDDQSLIINIKDKGLVILSGCAHSGIVKTVRYAQEISGVKKIHAVLGGFHLANRSSDEIEQTASELRNINPDFIIPSHCTGINALSRFFDQFPQEFICGVVGATYLF